MDKLKAHVKDEVKNKNGQLIRKDIIITNKINEKEGITFADINQLYKSLLRKHKAGNILIYGKPLDGGFRTIKTFDYQGNDLKYVDDDYMGSVPREIQKKLSGKYYSIEILIKGSPRNLFN
jgi:hypothetical protein